MCRSEQREEALRVHARLAEPHAPMQVRTGHPAGGPEPADDTAAFDGIAHVNVDARQMGEQRIQPEPMVDHHRVAGEEQRFGEHDPPGRLLPGPLARGLRDSALTQDLVLNNVEYVLSRA